MRESVVASLKRLFGDRGVNIDALNDETDLIEALDWDSMDAVDLGMEFERAHNVVLPQQAEQFNTISKLLGFFPASN